MSAPADYARPTTITRNLPRGHRTPCIRIDMVDPVRASTMPHSVRPSCWCWRDRVCWRPMT